VTTSAIPTATKGKEIVRHGPSSRCVLWAVTKRYYVYWRSPDRAPWTELLHGEEGEEAQFSVPLHARYAKEAPFFSVPPVPSYKHDTPMKIILGMKHRAALVVVFFTVLACYVFLHQYTQDTPKKAPSFSVPLNARYTNENLFRHETSASVSSCVLYCSCLRGISPSLYKPIVSKNIAKCSRLSSVHKSQIKKIGKVSRQTNTV
jgi:hypothetical protein